MAKRQPAFSANQMAFTFEAPRPDVDEGGLAHMERQTASAVARILRDDPRSRFEVAGQLSALMDADISKFMLDAYSAEARDGHNVSFARFLGLIVATQRFDVLDALMRQIGCAVVVGEEILLAEIGHLETQRRNIEQRLKSLKAEAKPLKRGGAHA